ncbi:heavy metal-binding domain-containing protein [Flavobacterium soyangense]|uniref:Heavy metal binding domain-containing protein n=1 Tax=Flavobacterium soyangense TaxID=2023265 RepID=A0A930U8U5_9FLAO|nr:heavy metal-binding domain-containing protein [Flavobacterium soyangense]MBF2709063.1 hypothetical protein [Flavobacterium soyangense]
MKNIIFSAIIMAFVLVSCNQKSKDVETNTPMMEKDSTKVNDSKAKIYACPMHPESQGKLNDKCTKCGMKLTKEVK